MVKLPKEDYLQQIRELLELCERNYNMQRRAIRLLDLEAFADLGASYMQANSNRPNIDQRQVAMNRIRQLFNLEFKIRCDVCGTAHDQDEITAPER